jgi:hypothetical protein
MDPTACCRLLADALTDNHQDDADEHAGNLLNWVTSGGFMPAQGCLEEITEIAADSLADLTCDTSWEARHSPFTDSPALIKLLNLIPHWIG